jgi:hypothetical protein
MPFKKMEFPCKSFEAFLGQCMAEAGPFLYPPVDLKVWTISFRIGTTQYKNKSLKYDPTWRKIG